MGVPASALAIEAVRRGAHALMASGARSATASSLFEAANDAAWDMGVMLSQLDVWKAVYSCTGNSFDSPPPEDAPLDLTLALPERP